ncbi:TIGR03085 family metal-binding protein [Cellulomonas soli]|uniref:TIGR03085 family metal-binding protein n=1 Tax=Cellulomonas soli TaxID=931535 RepID=UPI003F84DCC5
MTWHEVLRTQLADALAQAGPDAPTLCEGWRTRHLAAHVILRENNPLVGAGLVVPALAAHTERATEDLAATGMSEGGYRDLVSRVATPPAPWHPLAWAGEAANVVEFFVHTEDVRRGAHPVPPRELDPGLVEALWAQLPRFAALRARRVGVGLVVVRPDGVRRRLRSASDGHGSVVVRGQVGEVLLWLSGRGAAAQVHLEGAPQDLDALTDALPVR